MLHVEYESDIRNVLVTKGCDDTTSRIFCRAFLGCWDHHFACPTHRLTMRPWESEAVVAVNCPLVAQINAQRCKPDQRVKVVDLAKKGSL
jgi:hypothetical protein